MLWFDLIAATALIGFVSYGSMMGLVHVAARLIGLTASVLLTLRTFPVVWTWVEQAGSGSFTSQVVVFFVMLAVITKVVSYLVEVIDRLFRVLSALPFTKTANRLLGAVLGLCLGLLALSAAVVMLEQLPSLPTVWRDLMAASWFVRVVHVGLWLIGLLIPQGLAGLLAPWSQLWQTAGS